MAINNPILVITAFNDNPIEIDKTKPEQYYRYEIPVGGLVINTGTVVGGAVDTVNNKTPINGNVDITYVDVGADPVGAANAVKSELTQELDLKVDKTDLDQTNIKVDQLDSELSSIDAELDLKASKLDLDGVQDQVDSNTTAITNKPDRSELADVAYSGNYNALINVPDTSDNRIRNVLLTGIAFTVDTAIAATDTILTGLGKAQAQIDKLTTQLFNKVDKVAGKELSANDYTDLEKTKLSGIAVNATANQTDSYLLARANHTGTQPASTVTGLSTVATTNSYTDLDNKPNIPPAQVNSDWNSTSGLSQILNKPALSTVATSGSYNDLSNKPDTSDSRILGTLLAGLTTVTSIAITTTDSIISALGKLQAQITNNTNSISSNTTAISTKANSSININSGSGLQGGGNLTADRTLSLTDTGVVAGTYGSTTTVPVITVDAKGRATTVTTATIAGGSSDTPVKLSSGYQAGSPLSNNYYDNSINGGAFSTVPLVSNVPITIPVMFKDDLITNELGLNVTTAQTNGTLQVAIYSSKPSHGFPFQLIYTSSVMDASTTGFKAASISPSFTFVKNTLYWIRINAVQNVAVTAILTANSLSLGTANTGASMTPTNLKAVYFQNSSSPTFPNYFMFKAGDVATSENQPSYIYFTASSTIPRIVFKAV